jgi:flagellar biosynthetic protein FlhB
MADQAERTYPALPSRRRKFREQGEFARSRDLTGAGSFVAAMLALSLSLPMIARLCAAMFGGGVEFHDGALALTRELKLIVGVPIFIAVAACAGAMMGTIVQGMVFAPAKMSFDLSRLNPLQYFTRLFSSEFFVQLGKSTGGLLAVGVAAWTTALVSISSSPASRTAESTLILETTTQRFLVWSCAVMVLLGILDYAYRRYQFELKLRMTRQEFLDELKEEEGHPQLKRRRLRLMRQRARKLGGVTKAATASVVLVNPTHYAVALRYRRGFDRAPLCVAKGAGETAARIIGIAKLAGIPVVSNPPLCRALFQALEVGQEVSTRFYRAVAEVLAALMRAELKARAARAGIG